MAGVPARGPKAVTALIWPCSPPELP